MQEKFQISFILTSKLNQDALESLIGILRTRGGLDDHPTPIDLIYRLRMVLLGKIPGIVHFRTNIPPYQEDGITLTNIVLEKAEIEPLSPPDSYEEDDEEMECGTSPSFDYTSTRSSDNYIRKDGVEYLSG
ncbi:hypothetical protein JTB14_011741 [Gonioctena quinquepunctata]|nr:hypothetical protein JTB14_011741 [Gonioctena quinquepunctata]